MNSLKVEVRKGAYYDSVTLMLISKEIKKLEGVESALIGMGTDLNKELAANLNISNEEIANCGVNDLFISVLGNVEIEVVSNLVEELLSKKKSSSVDDYKPVSLDSAISIQSDSNLAIISIAGRYAVEETEKCLEKGLNVLLFSDNVSVEDERRLKEMARERNLLVMGPDCGTAIINNVPLAFANKIRKGSIGIVGASGTGIQEVTVLIHKLGAGVSQVIGTGGRDLKASIGGITMLQGIEALKYDEDTKVIVLISKPPEKSVMDKVLEAARDTGKPTVVCFIGGNKEEIIGGNIVFTPSLEEAAKKSVSFIKNINEIELESINEEMKEKNEAIIEKFRTNVKPSQKYLRGLFTGGTLAYELMNYMEQQGFEINSNIATKKEYELKNPNISVGNTVIDFGDDHFTLGRPHPMIDPSTRAERIEKELLDEEVAVVVMDFVLGYGSNEDPVGETIPSILKAKEIAASKGNTVLFLAYVCGTDDDPNDYRGSVKRLQDLDIVVVESNYQAAKLCEKLLNL